MEAYIIPTLALSLIFNCFFTVIIASRGFRNLVNFLFLLLTASVSVWIIALLGYFSNINLNLNWIIGTHISALTIAVVFYYFSFVFPRSIYKNKLLYSFPLIVYGITFYFLYFTNEIVGKSSGISYEINRGYLFYQLVLLFFFFAGYFNLYRQYILSNDHTEKVQVKYILIGSIFASVLAMVTDMVFPFVGIFNFTWLGSVFTLILVVSIFVAIVRYRLFNIRIIATEAFIFLLWAFLLIRTFIANTLSDQIINLVLFVATLLIGLLLIRSVMKEVSQREKIEKLAGELAKANNELQATNEKLKELDKQKTEFVSIASHQLRSPLTAIKGYSSMLLEGSYGKLSAKTSEVVDRIFQSSQKLVSVIEDFLNITRIELGRMKYEMSDFDLGKLAKQVTEELRPSIERQKLALTFEDDGRDHNIYADTGKINQVINNIIDNASKYTHEGWIKITVINIKNDLGEEFVRLAISDSGVGIDKDTIPKLFEKFVRAYDAGQTNIVGTGLGLYVAKQIVTGLSGKIWAESEGKGKGSTFFVELKHTKPLAIQQKEEKVVEFAKDI